MANWIDSTIEAGLEERRDFCQEQRGTLRKVEFEGATCIQLLFIVIFDRYWRIGSSCALMSA